MKLWITDDTNTKRELHWRWLTKEDMPAISQLEDRVEAHLDDPSLYRRDPLENILHSITRGAGCVGGFVEKELVALRYINYPKDYQLAEGIIGAEHFSKVLHMESMVVDPRFRGNALQLKSFHYMLAHLPASVPFLFSTVSPFNIPSLKSVFRYGSVMLDLRKMYPDAENPEGVLRYIGARGLVLACDDEVERVSREAIAEQQALFKTGYAATGMTDDNKIRFQRILCTAVPLWPGGENA